MNLLRFFTAAMLSLSLVGCCCNRCIVTDPCDPCGAIQPQGCCLSRMFNSALHRGYSWGSPCGCTCGSCGCGGEVMDPYSYAETSSCGGSCAAPMTSSIPSSSGCGCSQPAQYSGMPSMSAPTYMNSAPSTFTQPITPQPIPEVPPSTPNYAPAPPASTNAEPQTNMIPAGNGQPQMVSYEEFQKLPGKVVSGPEPTPNISIPAPVQQVSTSTSSFVVPPAPAPSAARAPSKFVRPGSNQQAVWTPSRSN